MKKIILFFFIAFSTSFLSAQIENVQLTLHLKNGDILTGKSDITQIEFKTSYGVLNFPIGDINSINIGLNDSNFDKSRLLDLLEKVELGNSKEKEKAFDEIIEMQEGAIPFIKSYLLSSSSNPGANEISIPVLYEVMLAKYKVSKNFNLYDELLFNGKNNIEGTYSFSHLVLETTYGRIKVERRQIERIDINIKPSGGFDKENTFKIFANRFVTGNKEEGWLNTGILVKKGDQITISADGQVILASLSGKKYSPDGGIDGAPGPTDKKINYGNLVFKIGQSGEEVKAGEEVVFTANRTGIIYLSIHETVYNSANSGYYSANVKVK